MQPICAALVQQHRPVANVSDTIAATVNQVAAMHQSDHRQYRFSAVEQPPTNVRPLVAAAATNTRTEKVISPQENDDEELVVLAEKPHRTGGIVIF